MMHGLHSSQINKKPLKFIYLAAHHKMNQTSSIVLFTLAKFWMDTPYTSAPLPNFR